MEKNLMDSSDYYELMLRHLICDSELYKKALKLGVTADDFLSSSVGGILIYKIFAEIAFETNATPISKDLFLLKLKEKFDKTPSLEGRAESAGELYEKVYATTLDSKYATDNLRLFVKRRRQLKAKQEHSTNEDALLTALSNIEKDLSGKEVAALVTIDYPFKKLLKQQLTNLIPTGFARIDTALGGGGIAKGEYGLIIGYTGGGKSAMAVCIVRSNAILGNKAAFVSMEETTVNISNRLYSQVFRINYSDLRSGKAGMELEQQFNENPDNPHRRLLSDNLALFGLKEATPITPAAILETLRKHFDDTGFIPDVVVLDQMQFMEPNEKKKNESSWDTQARLSHDCDWLSHQTIGGQPFGLWVLHQAKGGKMSKFFTHAEISGFKGILQPADIAIGIGREDQKSKDFGIFSLKTRHTAGFEVDYEGELEYMTFRDRLAGTFENIEAYQGPTSNPTREEMPHFRNPLIE